MRITTPRYFFFHILDGNHYLALDNNLNDLPCFTIRPKVQMHLHLCRSLSLEMQLVPSTACIPNGDEYSRASAHERRCRAIAKGVTSGYFIEGIEVMFMNGPFQLLEGYLALFSRRLPNLSQFRINHLNYEPNDPNNIHWVYRNCPTTITDLTLTYTYSPSTPKRAVEWFTTAKYQDHGSLDYMMSLDAPPNAFDLSQVTTLRIYGANPDLVMFMASRCPNAHAVFTDADVFPDDFHGRKVVLNIVRPIPVKRLKPMPSGVSKSL
jgi:hypothetical protein